LEAAIIRTRNGRSSGALAPFRSSGFMRGGRRRRVTKLRLTCSRPHSLARSIRPEYDCPFSGMPEMTWRDTIRAALAEDRATEDVTTALLGPAGTRQVGLRFIAEGPIVLAGIPLVAEAYAELDPGGDRPRGCPGGRAGRGGNGPGRRPAARHRALALGRARGAEFSPARLGVATRRGGSSTSSRTPVPRSPTRGRRFRGCARLISNGVRWGGVPEPDQPADAVMWKDNHWALLR
jgi:hypothetical protein